MCVKVRSTLSSPRWNGARCPELVTGSGKHVVVVVMSTNVHGNLPTMGHMTRRAAHPITMGPRGEVVWIWSVFDDGVMLNAIDTGMFEMVKGRLNELTASLKMADGRLVPLLGVWTG